MGQTPIRFWDQVYFWSVGAVFLLLCGGFAVWALISVIFGSRSEAP